MVESKKRQSPTKQDDTVSQKSVKSTASKNVQKNKQLLSIVNQIFAQNKLEKCTNLTHEWANGSKFQTPSNIWANFVDVLVLFMQLFNVLFDETYDLKLSTAESVDAKIGNWNKINAVICFNYFQ